MSWSRVGLLILAATATFRAGSVRAQPLAQPTGVSVTFLANEGVMLSSGTKKVLIDALFLQYETSFALPAESTQVALRNARAPFDAVDLILVTHHHGDHFHPDPMAAHLAANPRATLIASRQVIDSLRGRVAASTLREPRIMSRTTAPGTRRQETVNGVTVELLGIPHARVDHLGFIVELGGRRVLHVGDTDLAESVYKGFRLDTARIDVALLPEWMVKQDEGRRIIERWIRPRQVVAIHVGKGRNAEVRSAREVQAAMPMAITFTRSLDTRRW